MARKFGVRLGAGAQARLVEVLRRGHATPYQQRHARILLLADDNSHRGAMRDEEIARALQVGTATVERVRRRFVEEGLDSALQPRPQVKRRRKRLDRKGEALLVALAQSQPPEGRERWTLRMLADRLVEQKIVGSISTETVRQTLKRHGLPEDGNKFIV